MTHKCANINNFATALQNMDQFFAKHLTFPASYPSKVPAIRVWTFPPFPSTNELFCKEMNPVTNSLIRRITLVAALSLAACEKNDSRKADAEQAELPSSSESNVVIDLDLSNPNQEIIEFEGFVGHGSPVEVQPSENLGALPEDVIITESRTEIPEFRTQPDKFKEEAEQAGAGQPATRPVVQPEGGVQPQPESEGRSR